jgi:hypothetical protein
MGNVVAADTVHRKVAKIAKLFLCLSVLSALAVNFYPPEMMVDKS